MDKQHLLTIGNLSKQTGVHVKSLRYYEQLGILIPAYTDPDTGYRFITLFPRFPWWEPSASAFSWIFP